MTETHDPAPALLEQLPAFVRDHRLATLGKLQPDGEYVNEAVLVADLAEQAEVITSWTGETEPVKDGAQTSWEALANLPETFHRPVLDLDFDAALIPSSSADHHHLYLDKVLKWSDYVKLLNVLAEVGLIEPGYRDASIAREFTSVRLPWVSKQLPADPKPEVLTAEGDVYDPDRLCNWCDLPYGHAVPCGPRARIS